MNIFKRRKTGNEELPSVSVVIPEAEKLPSGEVPSPVADALAAAALHGANVLRQQAAFDQAVREASFGLADDISQGIDLSEAAARANAKTVNELMQTREFTASQREFEGVLQPGMDSSEILTERAKDQPK